MNVVRVTDSVQQDNAILSPALRRSEIRGVASRLRLADRWLSRPIRSARDYEKTAAVAVNLGDTARLSDAMAQAAVAILDRHNVDAPIDVVHTVVAVMTSELSKEGAA